MSVIFLSIDLQNDFATEGGAHYSPRPCVPFIRDTLFPFVRERGYKVVEIISDYRDTEPDKGTSVCIPGTWGYESLVPTDIKHQSVWVKSEPSPVWIREGAGEVSDLPGIPYPSPNGFDRWLSETIGPPSSEHEIVLIGLVFEICVLSTLQELHHRGYRAKVLFEAVDTYTGNADQKKGLFETLFPFWGSPLYWDEWVNTNHFEIVPLV
ncbi:cysteine hydrolase family protein [Paenibacillus sp. OV219]|uniref:cysteine hydrolase family protein n=1 Tax=Paenibacillus sp. OV219 TaxID=1884377 RepID=UPI0008AF8AA0|nr:isochorismatase family protein [Paenibacillus sp. OV219]SEN97557.1 Nicotinamidase-related amidase [Paenibacillus sp. OV219]